MPNYEDKYYLYGQIRFICIITFGQNWCLKYNNIPNQLIVPPGILTQPHTQINSTPKATQRCTKVSQTKMNAWEAMVNLDYKRDPEWQPLKGCGLMLFKCKLSHIYMCKFSYNKVLMWTIPNMMNAMLRC